MSHAEPGRPLGELLGGLASDISGLFRKEIQLAKAEASEKIGEVASAGRTLAVGAILAIGAVGVFLAAVVAGLATLLVAMGLTEPLANFVSGLVVSAVVGIAAWSTVTRGLSELKAENFNMQRTAQSLQMDVAAVREKI